MGTAVGASWTSSVVTLLGSHTTSRDLSMCVSRMENTDRRVNSPDHST